MTAWRVNCETQVGNGCPTPALGCGAVSCFAHFVMLYLVISSPRPEAPSAIRQRQKQFWDWFDSLSEQGTVRHVYARLGRGLVAVMEVDAPETLHALLNQWAEFIPASFEVQSLMSRDHQAQLVRTAAAAASNAEQS